jgi:hypothetical protein
MGCCWNGFLEVELRRRRNLTTLVRGCRKERMVDTIHDSGFEYTVFLSPGHCLVARTKHVALYPVMMIMWWNYFDSKADSDWQQ